jgi:hypothetical protein
MLNGVQNFLGPGEKSVEKFSPQIVQYPVFLPENPGVLVGGSCQSGSRPYFGFCTTQSGAERNYETD